MASGSRFDTGDRDAGREPCPDRIVEDLGGAFGMGCIGGFVWHSVKGARNAPSGERFATAMYSARQRAPILGGNFAVWGGTFSCFDCSLQYIRRRDDHWNAIASGFLTGGVLAARGGWKAASRNAVIGGVLLAIIEGVASLLMRSSSKTPREMHQEQMEQERQMEAYQKRVESGQVSGVQSWVQYAQAGMGMASSSNAE
jgi:import inner membrane translocase subunit TIM17